MFFSAFSTPVTAYAVTIDAIRVTTGLTWAQVDLGDPRIPADQGVYAWVDDSPARALWYHGSGSGAGGLQGRLSGQLRWRAAQRAALDAIRAGDADALTEQHSWDTAREMPAVQQAAKAGRQLHYAIATPASWTVERSEIEPPQSALQWEAFISAVSLLVTGHRGLVGGGAWESKTGTIASLMTSLAWDRLVDVSGGSWK